MSVSLTGEGDFFLSIGVAPDSDTFKYKILLEKNSSILIPFTSGLSSIAFDARCLLLEFPERNYVRPIEEISLPGEEYRRYKLFKTSYVIVSFPGKEGVISFSLI